jgi:hypothetical protein
MDWYVDFLDPLAGLVDVPRHPSITEETITREFESTLPSQSQSPASPPLVTPSLPLVAEGDDDLHERAASALAEYAPVRPSDDTRRVLEAFLHHLPAEGKVVLMAEVVRYASEPPKLRELRNFLVEAILKPRMLLSYLTSP